MYGRGPPPRECFIERLWRSLKYERIYSGDFASGEATRGRYPRAAPGPEWMAAFTAASFLDRRSVMRDTHVHFSFRGISRSISALDRNRINSPSSIS